MVPVAEDAEGFVDSVTDFYGMETKERICPYCHNPLPPNYGKYKVHFIATVGITSSGKTVYLSQLLRRMDEYMANVGLGTLNMTSANNKFLKEHPVKMDMPLPKGTLPGALSDPLFYVVLDNNVYHTLVFYDVAGENCVKPEDMGKYGPFIENADGIIMILDPNQFSVINQSYDGDETTSPKAVVQAMFNSFLSSKNVNGPAQCHTGPAVQKAQQAAVGRHIQRHNGDQRQHHVPALAAGSQALLLEVRLPLAQTGKSSAMGEPL